jgi:thiol-disulfide isomerase/thioredoxin
MSADLTCALVKNNRDLIEILGKEDRVIALFHASWCPFCARFLPVFKKYAEDEGRYFVSVQDDNETIADRYSVKVYPSVLFFEKGIVTKRLDGVSGSGLNEKLFQEFVSACPASKC